MKTVIIYSSRHHQNTFQLVSALKRGFGVELVNADRDPVPDLCKYDCVGFASGIEHGKLYDSVQKVIDKSLPENKRIFFAYTCGSNGRKYREMLRNTAKECNCELLGIYSCKGVDTYGPMKLVGGINKGRPALSDIIAFIGFYTTNCLK